MQRQQEPDNPVAYADVKKALLARQSKTDNFNTRLDWLGYRGVGVARLGQWKDNRFA